MLAKKIFGSGRQAIARPQAPPLRWFARRRPAPEATPRGAHLPLGKPARLAQGGGQAGGAPRCKNIAGTQLAALARSTGTMPTDAPGNVRARHGDGVWP